jgi:hypothetical protein
LLSCPVSRSRRRHDDTLDADGDSTPEVCDVCMDGTVCLERARLRYERINTDLDDDDDRRVLEGELDLPVGSTFDARRLKDEWKVPGRVQAKVTIEDRRLAGITSSVEMLGRVHGLHHVVTGSHGAFAA